MKIQNNISKRTILRIAAAVLAILIGITGVLLYVFRDRLFAQRIRLGAVREGPTEEMLTAAEENGYRPDLQMMRMKSVLIDQPQTSPYILSLYLLPGQLLSMPAGQSEYVDATDQALLMRLYVARGDRREATALFDAIERDFSDGNGGVVGARSIEDLEHLAGKVPVNAYVPEPETSDRIRGTSLEAGSAYLRALLEYYERWGGADVWTRIRELTGAIYSEDEGLPSDYIIVSSPELLMMYGLTDYEAFFRDADEETETYRVIKLCAPDLRAYQVLADADAAYAPIYDEAVDIVRGGYISEDLPLFALAYSREGGEYVYYSGGEARVRTVPSLCTMLHLAEVGALPRESLSWIRKQIFNTGYIYTEYDIITGAAASDVDAVEAYGLILQIAVAEGDLDLYMRTLDRLSRSRATLETSPALHMIFRKAGERRNMTTAADNLRVLLAMTGP